jgi:hypothetical protein
MLIVNIALTSGLFSVDGLVLLLFISSSALLAVVTIQTRNDAPVKTYSESPKSMKASEG